jgi:uncharacterized protein (TIGR03083 family)
MTDETPTPRTVPELLDLLTRERAAFEQALAALTPAQLTGPRDAAGWSAQDHLVHLTAWERSVVYLLRGRPRHEGLGVDEATYLNPGDDFVNVNAAIVRQARGQSLEATQAEFQAVHAELRTLLAGLTDADLQRPYGAYLPAEPGDGPGRPVIGYIMGNTVEHYQEHLPWIQSLVASAPGA